MLGCFSFFAERLLGLFSDYNLFSTFAQHWFVNYNLLYYNFLNFQMNNDFSESVSTNIIHTYKFYF